MHIDTAIYYCTPSYDKPHEQIFNIVHQPALRIYAERSPDICKTNNGVVVEKRLQRPRQRLLCLFSDNTAGRRICCLHSLYGLVRPGGTWRARCVPLYCWATIGRHVTCST